MKTAITRIVSALLILSFPLQSFAATTTLQDLTFSYDKAGNITQIIDRAGIGSSGTTSYSYDNLYRLTRASTTSMVSGNYLQTYVYDSLGNITNKSDVGAYTYGATGYANPDAVTSIGSRTNAYDQAGNLTSSGNGSATTTYTWDYRSRMTYSTMSGTSSAYAYDANDARVSQAVKKGAGATTTTSYFNQYYEKTGATTTMYVYAAGQLLATIEGSGKSTTTGIVHTDQLGSTNVVSSATGTMLQLANYYPYGATRQNVQQTTLNEKRKFIGQYADDATNLSYLNARYYNGTNGQFFSQDPVSRDLAMMQKQPAYILAINQINGYGDVDQTSVLSSPQLLNSYSYAANSPITKSDPSGRCLPACAGVLAIPGAGEVAAIGAVAILGTAALYYGTNALLQKSGWGTNYNPPVTLDPAKMGFGNPPTGPEDWLPNLPPNLPKWAKVVIGGLTVGSIAAETYEQYKDIKDKFTNPTDPTNGPNSKQQNGQQTLKPPPNAPAGGATPSNTQNSKQGQTSNKKP